MKRLLIPAALVGLLMIIAGCGSDILAPNDPLPTLSEQASATQASLVAYSVATVGPLAVTYSAKSEIYNFPGGSDIEGSVLLDFRTGGAEGTASTPGNADYVEITTMGDDGLTVTAPLGGQLHVTADIMADITRGANDSATVLSGSNGFLEAGDYHTDFTIGAVTVYETGKPTGGPVVCDNGYHTVEIDFDGTALADLSLDGLVRWRFNLDTLELLEVD